MNYLNRYDKFNNIQLLKESIQNAKQTKDNIIKDLYGDDKIKKDKILTDVIGELKKIMNKTPNLIGSFFNYFINEDIPIYSDENNYNDSLSGLYEFIIVNKNKIKEYLDKDIISYDSFEYLTDDINDAMDKAMVKKFTNKFFHKKLRDKIDLDNSKQYDMLLTYLKMPEDKRPNIKSTRSYGSIELFFRSLGNKLNNVDNTDYKKQIYSTLGSFNDSNYRVFFENDDILVVETFDRAIIGEMGGDWCIVNNQDSFFSTYVNPSKGNTQYLIYDFSKLPSDPKSLFGVTINKNGKTRSGMCQDRENRYVPLDNIVSDLGLPDSILISKYAEIPTMLSGYISSFNNMKTLEDYNNQFDEIKDTHRDIWEEIKDMLVTDSRFSFENIISFVFDEPRVLEKTLDNLKNINDKYPECYDFIKNGINAKYSISEKAFLSESMPTTLLEFKPIYNKYKKIIDDISPFSSCILSNIGIVPFLKYGKKFNLLNTKSYKDRLVNHIDTTDKIEYLFMNMGKDTFLNVYDNTLGLGKFFDTISNSDIKETYSKYEFMKAYIHGELFGMDLIKIRQLLIGLDVRNLIDMLAIMLRNETNNNRIGSGSSILIEFYEMIYRGIDLTNYKMVYEQISDYHNDGIDLINPNVFIEQYGLGIFEHYSFEKDVVGVDDITDYLQWYNDFPLESDFVNIPVIEDYYIYNMFVNMWSSNEPEIIDNAKKLLDWCNITDAEYLNIDDVDYMDIIEVYIDTRGYNYSLKELVEYFTSMTPDIVEDNPLLGLYVGSESGINEWLESQDGYNESDSDSDSDAYITVVYDSWYDDELNELFDKECRLDEDYYERFEQWENNVDWDDAPELSDENTQTIRKIFDEAGFDTNDDIDDILNEDIDNDDAYEFIDISDIKDAIETSVTSAQSRADETEYFEDHTNTLFEIFNSNYKEKGYDFNSNGQIVFAISKDTIKSLISDGNIIPEYIYDNGIDDSSLDIKDLLKLNSECNGTLYHSCDVYGTIDEDYFNEILSDRLYDLK